MIKIAYRLFSRSTGTPTSLSNAIQDIALPPCAHSIISSTNIHRAPGMCQELCEMGSKTSEFLIQLFTILLLIRYWLALSIPKHLIASTLCVFSRILVFYVKNDVISQDVQNNLSCLQLSKQLKKAPDSSSPSLFLLICPLFSSLPSQDSFI